MFEVGTNMNIRETNWRIVVKIYLQTYIFSLSVFWIVCVHIFDEQEKDDLTLIIMYDVTKY